MATQTETTMKALNYQGPFKVAVEDVPKPSIEHPDDVVVKVTTSCMGCLLPSEAPRLMYTRQAFAAVISIWYGLSLIMELPFLQSCEVRRSNSCASGNHLW